ncbi:fibronectin type III domain-containing protein [Streptomyces sp. NPDC050535]|uniref:fibronectin type III domain-containing protein n=1 Tax=Streptomyces sp. NPDC050535 TaxID=3365626 RepID=UPI0037A15E76
MRIPVQVAVPAVLLLALSACSVPQRAGDEPGLRASLTTPTDIDLDWQEDNPEPSGHALEFATERSGPWTVLQYLPPGVRTYRHPDLMPGTTFFYRLRAFDGPASAPLTVSLPEGEMTKADEDADHDWLPARKDPGRVVPGRPLDSSGAGAPTGFKAVVKHANGILFTWTDHASNEAGFLLEARMRGNPGYEPLVVLDPDINSTGLITLPTEKRASYRVRAFSYGELSNTVRLTTGE